MYLVIFVIRMLVDNDDNKLVVKKLSVFVLNHINELKVEKINYPIRLLFRKCYAPGSTDPVGMASQCTS